jgi:hypothetical protein
MGRPRKKFHWSIGSRKHESFELTEADWKAIESESKYALAASARDRILNATKHFLMMAEMERNAPLMYPGSQSKKKPKLNAVELRLQKIKTSVRNLSKVLQENSIDSKNKPEFEADHYIMLNCKELPELGGAQVAGRTAGRRQATLLLADLPSRFLVACKEAERELKIFKNASLFKDGDAWNKWVFSLGQLLEEHGHYISASQIHSNDGYDEDLVPPFVLLIKALQKLLPHEFVRQRSDAALAKAAQRALRASPQDS